MVDIVQCDACGRTIPAIPQGCAYCQSEENPLAAAPFIPLRLKAFFLLYAGGLLLFLIAGCLQVLEIARGPADNLPSILLPMLRCILALAAGLALLARQPWQRWWPPAQILYELVVGLKNLDFLLAGAAILLLVFFLRRDVQAQFDRRIWDRQEVDDLLRTMKGKP